MTDRPKGSSISRLLGRLRTKSTVLDRDERLRVELAQLEQRLTEPGRYSNADGAKSAIASLLNEASASSDGEKAWLFVHEAARREIVFLTPNHFDVLLTQLRCEIDSKLDGWRLTAA